MLKKNWIIQDKMKTEKKNKCPAQAHGDGVNTNTTTTLSVDPTRSRELQ